GMDRRGIKHRQNTALNIAFVGITFWLIPETKNVTLEHIERKLMAGEKLRNIGV
ncbi:sugar porter family MFS transporter, partial [Escherichia coli]|nr:sugar porter family MFS transporter [Escherichia coli]